MIEIFIPTEIPDILSLHLINPGFFSLLHDHFSVTVSTFESRFFCGFRIMANDESLDFCILCNGTFGSEYFIDYDWENKKVTTLGKSFFDPDMIGQELGSIVSDFDSIVKTLSSEALLTLSKKEESIAKIKHSFFLLSGVVFNLSELLRKTRENIQELEILSTDPSQEIEYQGQSILLIEPLRTKEIELATSIETLEQKVAMLIDATKHFITT